MKLIATTCYGFNTKLLLYLGLWPTPLKRYRLYQLFMYGFYLPYVVHQTTWFYTAGCNLRWMIIVLTFFLLNVLGLLRFMFYQLYGPTVVNIYKNIESDWKYLENEKYSMQTLQKYAGVVHYFTLAATIFWFVLNFATMSLCIILSNWGGSEKHESSVTSIASDKTGCKSGISVLNPVAAFSFLNLITTDTTYLAFTEHACSLFKIASYHLRYATQIKTTDFPASSKTADIYTRITFAVHVHCKAIKLVQFVWDKFWFNFGIALVFGGITAVGGLISFCQMVEYKDDLIVTILSTICTISIFSYVSLIAQLGQRVTDHSIKVFLDAYNSNWYEIPPGAQKFYLIIMQRSINTCKFSVPGWFVMSREGFATFLQASFSFFTVFYSLQAS